MKVMVECQPLGVLHPSSITTVQVEALGSGQTVIAHMSHDDLNIDECLFRALALVAHGETKIRAAHEAGMSSRTLRRQVAPLLRAANVGTDFAWPILSHIFEDPSN